MNSQPPSQSHGSEQSLLVRVLGSRSWATATLAVLVFAVALWQNLSAVTESPFHPDESRWVNRSDYLREIFDPTSDVWEDRYLTRGQPPMGSFVTGLGLLLQGRELGQNGPWDFHFGNESNVLWNAAKGNMPSAGDIIAGRRTSAVVGALTCLALFLILTWLTDWIGGLIGALFLAFHPLQVYLASLAVSDAVFTLLVALATLAAIMLATRPSWPRAIALGVILGMGTSTKLSPLFVAVALAGIGAVFLIDQDLRRLPVVGKLWARLLRGNEMPLRRLGWMLVTLPAIAFAFFVLTYPYLWPDPVGRTHALLDFRQHEMENQARIWPTFAIDSRVEAVQRTWQTLEHGYSTSDRAVSALGRALDRDWTGFSIDLPIAVAGLAIFSLTVLVRGLPAHHLLALAVVGSQSAIILAKLSVDFNRYYLPLVFASALGVGLLIGQVSLWIQRAVSQRRTRVTLAPAGAGVFRHGLKQLDRGRSQSGGG